MGIFIYMSISKSVTKQEWKSVYEETLELVKAFPLAERRKVECRGIETICLVPTIERDKVYGWNNEKTKKAWFASGDYISMRTAETYSLYRELIKEEEVECDARDALWGALPAYLDYDRDDPRCNCNYELWGNKTQGEPYHMYLLAIACLIESRLGKKAFVYGDITRGQCRRAVELANRYLKEPIDIPDRCDLERFSKRVSKLELDEKEKVLIFENLYLGTKDSKFGEFIRNTYSEETLSVYWKNRFEGLYIDTIRFDECVSDYLLWGFDLGKLCRLVNYNDKEDVLQYKAFVERIMDAKLYLKDKNCDDAFKINQDNPERYGVYTLLAHIMFSGVSNKKVDRYIPIDEIKKVLLNELGDKCNVDGIIEEYLENEKQQSEKDVSDIVNRIMDTKRENYEEEHLKYDICDYDKLIYYEDGDTLHPDLKESLRRSFLFYESATKEETYQELMEQSAEMRCKWLIEQNRSILIRDRDWNKIFKDIEENKESFARYYPMMRVSLNSDGLIYLVMAMVINDELYGLCKEMTV